MPATPRWRLRNLSIRRKLTVIILVTSGIAVVVASAGFVAWDYGLFRQRMVRDLGTTAEGIVGYTAPWETTLCKHDPEPPGSGTAPRPRAAARAWKQAISTCIGGLPVVRARFQVALADFHRAVRDHDLY